MEISGWTLRYETKYTSNSKVYYSISWKTGRSEWTVDSMKSSTAVVNIFLQVCTSNIYIKKTIIS